MNIEATLVFDETLTLNKGEKIEATIVLDTPYIKMDLYEFVLSTGEETEVYFVKEDSDMDYEAIAKVVMDEEIRPEVFHASNDQMQTTPTCSELWVSDLYQYIVKVHSVENGDTLTFEIEDRMFGLTKDQIGLTCILVMYNGENYSRVESIVTGETKLNEKACVTISYAEAIVASQVKMVLVTWQ